jgi:hypothetical protein
MQPILLDVLTAEGYSAFHNSAPTDSNRQATAKYYSEIFAKYHVTKEEYTRSYKFYAQHPDLFEKTISPVIDSLNAMEARIPAFGRSSVATRQAPADDPNALKIIPGPKQK